MGEMPEFDAESGHRFFSAHCFNRAWELIEKQGLSQAEIDEMIHAAHASAWHWGQRPDRTGQNLSISLWQLSRVYALAGEAGPSRRYALACLQVSQDESPFLLGYAHEAMARAARLTEDQEVVRENLERARQILKTLTDPEERQLLEKELGSIDR
jgi:hypothetical protein